MKSFGDVLRSIIQMIKAILTIKPDILHIQYRFTREQGGSAGEPLLFLMLVVKKLTKAPKIILSLHDFWLPKEAEQRAYEITKSRVAARLYRFYYAMYIRATLNTPDLVVSIVNARKSAATYFIEKYTRQTVVEVLHGLPSVSQHSTQAGGNADAKCCKEKLGVSNKFTILLFGFVRRAKAYHYVIRAVRKLIASRPLMKERIKVRIVGVPAPAEEQYYLNYLKELVHKLDLDDVVSIAPKYLTNDEIDLSFGAADITVAPYIRRVGPSGVLSFALAYEIPSIVTCDGKYISHGTGLPALTVNLDVNEIASAILQLMTDKDEYAKQIQRIREYKAANSNRKIALSHIKLYEKLCS